MDKQQQIEAYCEVNGIEPCDFDDECDSCKTPTGGSFARMSYIPEIGRECDYYICGACLESAAIAKAKGERG